MAEIRTWRGLYKQVQFQDLDNADFFLEDPEGPWHMKTDSTTAVYHNGYTIVDLAFEPGELVWVENYK